MFGYLNSSRRSQTKGNRKSRGAGRRTRFESLETRNLLTAGLLLSPMKSAAMMGNSVPAAIASVVSGVHSVKPAVVASLTSGASSGCSVAPADSTVHATAVQSNATYSVSYFGIGDYYDPVFEQNLIEAPVSGATSFSVNGGIGMSPASNLQVNFTTIGVIGGWSVMYTFTGTIGANNSAAGTWTASPLADTIYNLPAATGHGTWTASTHGAALTSTPGGNAVPGSGEKLTDLVTLSHGYYPSGSITFTLRAPGGAVVDTEMVPVNGNGSYSDPVGFLPTTQGTYQWSASYSGDRINSGTVAPSAGETCGPASPTLKVTTAGTVVLGDGSKLTESVTLSGGYKPTDTISFVLTAPDGKTVVDTEMVHVNGNGVYSTPNGYLPTAPGTYHWSASYSGNAQNYAAQDPNKAEKVRLATPTITAAPSAPVVVGSGAKLTELVALSGGYNATGTIMFTLRAPNDKVVDVETVNVNGDGAYSTSMGYVPNAHGEYRWVVRYSGDGDNEAVKLNLPITVDRASPALVTTPGGTVILGSGAQLTASAVLSNGFNPTGKITFTLYGPNNKVVHRATVKVNGNGTYAPAVGYLPNAAGAYRWVAKYNGDSENDKAVSAAVSEQVFIQVDPPVKV